MSIKSILDNNGPRTDSCGTPYTTSSTEAIINFNSLLSMSELN